MKYKIKITNNAQRNLENIANFIKLDSKIRAQTWLKLIKSKIKSLEFSPMRGRKVPEYEEEKEIREVFIGNYRIIYEIDENLVYIFFVYHGAKLLEF